MEIIYRKVRIPITKMETIEKKKINFWKIAKRSEYEDKMQKWKILARQRNEFIACMLQFQTHYTMDSNAFMFE